VDVRGSVGFRGSTALLDSNQTNHSGGDNVGVFGGEEGEIES
jgi:hypothetical protein